MSQNWAADFDQQISREALETRAAKGASALNDIGAGVDKAVAVIMRNDLTQLEIMRAAALSGTVIVALNWHGAADEVAAICADSHAEIVIIHRDLIAELRPALQGRQVIAVTPGPALCAAYDISPQAATADPDSAPIMCPTSPPDTRLWNSTGYAPVFALPGFSRSAARWPALAPISAGSGRSAAQTRDAKS